jgi:protein farnesyltransferase/geranylgeranyltransferase type-1 subunit alpha
MFQKDAKNYHVWSYRQWLVKRFGLWEKGELEYVEYLLEQDVRNNSAWSHRFFLVCGNGQELTEEIVQRELEYVPGNPGMKVKVANEWQLCFRQYLPGAAEPESLELCPWVS